MKQKTIKTLSSDVNVTLHQTNELLVKVNVLADDINIKVATIDPLFTAVADLSESVSDLNQHARVLGKKSFICWFKDHQNRCRLVRSSCRK